MCPQGLVDGLLAHHVEAIDVDALDEQSLEFIARILYVERIGECNLEVVLDEGHAMPRRVWRVSDRG